MKKYLTLITLFFTQFLIAQQLNKSGEKIIGGAEKDVIYQSLQALNGNIYAVGETSSQSKGGSDGYLIILNPFGQEMIERRFGGASDDVLLSIAALPNGNFVLAGTTESKGNGKTDAWAIYVDEKGRVLNEKTYGTSGNDAFNVVVATDDGSVFFAGTQNDQKQSDIWVVKEVDTVLVFDKQFSIGKYVKNIRSGVADTEGSLVLVGDTKKTETVKSGDIWVSKIDKNGKSAPLNKRYGEANTYEEAAQIIKTSDGGFAVVGRTDNTRGKKINAWLLKLDVAGNQQWQENYGGSDFDYGTSVTQTANEQFIVVGSTLSHSPDARTRQIYIVRTDESGRMLREENDGGKQDDDASHIITLYDGSYGLFSSVSGFTNGKGGRDIWYYTFKTNEDNSIEQASLNDNTFQYRDWKINGGDVLETNQRTFLSVDIVNTTPFIVKNVQLQLKSPVSDISIPSVLYLGFMRKNETRHVIIPISSTVGLLENQYFLEAQLMVNNRVFSKFSKPINVKKGVARTVFIRPLALVASDTLLKFVVENPTNAPTQNLKLMFKIPNELKDVNGGSFADMEPISAGKNREIMLKIKPYTEGSSVKAKITTDLFEGDVLRDKVIFDILPNKTQNIGTQITWHSPDEYRTNIQNIVTNKSEFEIELNVDAYEPLQRNQFRVWVDETSLEGSKMDVADLSPPTELDNIFRQTYSAKLTLTAAKSYHIRVELATNKGVVVSKTLIVRYDPERPNLHILSIGTTNRDLKYTAKDAKDFAKSLETQAKDVFKQIFTTTLSDSVLTTERGIRKAFKTIRENYENPNVENRIFAKDYLVVFISSHGKTSEDKRFKLLPSDYNPSDGDEFTIDYQDIALTALDKIKCHKLVFIDACHSGAAKGSKGTIDAESLMKLSRAAVGTTTITSCRSDEQSYEDNDWENGAFTEALMEAFANKKCTDETGSFSSDGDDNHKITIKEVFNFLKRRVPNLVKNQKTNRVTEQNPVLNENNLDMDLPIIIY
jgi:hypothetical protein